MTDLDEAALCIGHRERKEPDAALSLSTQLVNIETMGPESKANSNVVQSVPSVCLLG